MRLDYADLKIWPGHFTTLLLAGALLHPALVRADAGGADPFCGGPGTAASVWRTMQRELQEMDLLLPVTDKMGLARRNSALARQAREFAGFGAGLPAVPRAQLLRDVVDLGLHTGGFASGGLSDTNQLEKIRRLVADMGAQFPPASLQGGLLDFSGALQPVKPLLMARIIEAGPLRRNQTNALTLRLTRSDGAPALLAELLETHTRKIHLLIIDEGLEDYHHEHPEPTTTPGEYRFHFIPRGPGQYRLWANTLPAVSGREEFASADLPAFPSPGRAKGFSTNLTAHADGLRYELQFDGGTVKAGRVTIGRIKIFTDAGVPVSRLEPLMGAFAHIAAFHEDFQTALHTHPLNVPESALDRGGPILEFRLLCPKGGFVRLIAQMQLDGAARFVSFGVRVED